MSYNDFAKRMLDEDEVLRIVCMGFVRTILKRARDSRGLCVWEKPFREFQDHLTYCL